MLYRVAATLVVFLLFPVACTSSEELDLARDPYMGITCDLSDPECDEIGLAVWLKEVPLRAGAEVDGRHFALGSARERDGQPPTHVHGFVDGIGLREPPFEVTESWRGSPPVLVPVRIEAEMSDGRTASVELEVRLQPGWG